ncbi:MAG: glycine C-acetyltransferase, partial [Rikenellaceae bacterium]|nr:glycine C-acetyltransferase [Rikenellaceae bacterium]
MYGKMKQYLQDELAAIKEAGLYKNERIITSAQQAQITVKEGGEVINFCANNYLGLSNHPRLIEAAKRAMDERGFGMSSVRF